MDDNIGLWDLDGSLADYDGQLRWELNKIRSPDEPLIEDLWEMEKLPHIKARMRLIKSQPNWWANLPVIGDGLRVFEIAQRIGFRNIVLTKGPHSLPSAWKEKVEWSQRQLGENIGIQITCDKSLVYGKFLYDDYPEYMSAWLDKRPRGLGIMPATNGNRNFRHPRVVRFYDGRDIPEVKAALEVVYNRKSGEELTWKP